MTYQFKTKPFAHQQAHFDTRRQEKAWALLWEQGTGKTKPIIDTAADLYERSEIDAVVVVAPNGVHRNWKTDELPAHLPDRLARLNRTQVEFWESQKASTKTHAARMKGLLDFKGFSWFLVSYDAFVTKAGKDFLWKFLRKRRVLMVLDEGHNIKTPGAKRTKSIVAAGKYALYRRLLTGTPVAIGPFDLYSQVKFLDENFWKRKRLDDYRVFKFHFGEWLTRAEAQQELGYDPGYDKLIRYKNVEQLAEWLKEISDRLTKDQVLDLPPKLFSKRYYELNGEQARVYKELKEQYESEFEDGARVDGALAIVRLLRLQQVLCGYAQTDDEEPVRSLGNHNPLLEACEAECESLAHPAIIWARFTKDIDQLMDMLGGKAVRYDGTLSDDEAERSKLAFQKGDAQFFVGNAQKGGSGLTLIQARTMMYYSHSFRLIDRLQSEDRAHRIGQEHPVHYIDFIGTLPGGFQTVSHHIVKSLRSKFDIANQLTGDAFKEWI